MKFLGLLTILMLNFSIANAAYADEAMDKSCKAYVQDFYDWYIKSCQGVHKDEPSTAVFKNKKFTFSNELQAQMKDDYEFAKQFPGDIVGLDFDPYLNAQDILGKYTAEKVSLADTKYHVEVFNPEGKKSKKATVTPELAYENGHWVFVNFLYPNADIPQNRDLLSVLKQLKKDRPPLPGSSKPHAAAKTKAKAYSK